MAVALGTARFPVAEMEVYTPDPPMPPIRAAVPPTGAVVTGFETAVAPGTESVPVPISEISFSVLLKLVLAREISLLARS